MTSTSGAYLNTLRESASRDDLLREIERHLEEKAAARTASAEQPSEGDVARSIASMVAEWYRGPARGDQDIPADLILRHLQRFAPRPARPDAGEAVTEAQYLAVVGGRSDFRNAYRRALVVVKYGRVLRDKWRVAGQKIDSDDFLYAVADTCDAVDQFDFGSGKIEDAHPPAASAETARVAEGCHGLDTPERVCFYEQDFYPLSNFSSFRVEWSGFSFDTSEHLYHWLKFSTGEPSDLLIGRDIKNASSAHEAFKIAEANKATRRADWDDVKVGFMRHIIREKVDQHEYVRRKLLATGDRELVENSWRDDFWGWGPNRDGQNMLGKLWMELRAELRAAIPAPEVQS